MKNLLFALSILFFLMACNSSTTSQYEENKSDSTIVTSHDSVIDTTQLNTNPVIDTLINNQKFKATGNEPFWLVEIDFSKSIHFKTMNGLDITTPIPEGVKITGTNTTRYSTVTDQGDLIVEITHEECINDMSGLKSDYSVLVRFKNKTATTYEDFKGCGMYEGQNPKN